MKIVLKNYCLENKFPGNFCHNIKYQNFSDNPGNDSFTILDKYT